MTDQMEPVDDATQYRRRIDDSLARFSAAHDELAAEEEERKQRRTRITEGPGRLIEQTRTRLVKAIAPARTAEEGEASGPGKGKPAEDSGTTKAAQTRLQEKKQRRTERSLLTGRITAIAVAALVFLATGVGWGAKTWFNSKFNEIAALDQNSEDIRNAAAQSGDQNFLIVGSDTRAGAEAEAGIGTADGIQGARSDTIMVAHLPADRKRAIVVSFPRDLEISRPDCERWDPRNGRYTGTTVPGDEVAKLNTAYAIGGPRCVTKVIQQVSGMRMNHFVGIDFNGFKGMVDAVGGVPVHVEQRIKDRTLGMVVPRPGDIVLAGDEALNYVRARHVIGDPTSDYGRIERQQKFISALLNKAMSQQVLFDPGKLTGFVNAFAASTFGENIGVDQLLALGQSMQGLNTSAVRFVTVPTTGEANSRGNEVLREQRSGELFQALIHNAPLPSERPPGAGSPSVEQLHPAH